MRFFFRVFYNTEIFCRWINKQFCNCWIFNSDHSHIVIYAVEALENNFGFARSVIETPPLFFFFLGERPSNVFSRSTIYRLKPTSVPSFCCAPGAMVTLSDNPGPFQNQYVWVLSQSTISRSPHFYDSNAWSGIYDNCKCLCIPHHYLILSNSHNWTNPRFSITHTQNMFSAREILPQWDKQIQSLCYQVNSLIEKIAAAEPEWMAKLMEEEMIQ